MFQNDIDLDPSTKTLQLIILIALKKEKYQPIQLTESLHKKTLLTLTPPHGEASNYTQQNKYLSVSTSPYISLIYHFRQRQIN